MFILVFLFNETGVADPEWAKFSIRIDIQAIYGYLN